MKKTKRALAALAITIYMTVLASCSLTGQLLVDGESGMVLDSKTEFSQVFRDLMDDMSGSKQTADMVMDEIVATALSSTATNAASYTVLEDGFYGLKLDISDIVAFLLTKCTQKDVDKLITTTDDLIRITIDKESWQVLKLMVPVLDDPYLSVYGPEYNDIYTDEEYLDMMEFLFDSNCEIRKAIQESVVHLVVKTEKKEDVVVDIPLIRLLTLNQPVVVEIKR